MATTKIRSSSIEDGQVSNADLSSTIGVTGAQIADDAIITAKILDNNVTLAKMADGTQGDTLYYGASGAPTLLPKPGTPADEVLTFATGATAPSWVAASSAGFVEMKVYTAASSVWTKPADVTKIVVEVQGAGGGGGGGNTSKGAGGGAGGYSRKFLSATDLANTTSADVAVGAFGAGGASNGAGTAGGASTFTEKVGSGGWTEVKGLGGGGGAANYGTGGTSGVASGGDMHIDGGTGGGNTNENNHGGGSFYTPMHYSLTGGANPPTAGTGYGGGGEGSRGTIHYSGAAGISGIVIVWEYK